MRFLVDENLPIALALWLRKQGYEAAHTSSLDLNASPDLELARYAIRTGSVVVTKDKDFLAMSASNPCVLHVRAGNLSSAELISLCEAVWPLVETSLRAGEQIVTLRGAG